MSIDELLGAARARLLRVDPHAAHAALRDGALLVDIRSESQRRADGLVPGSTFIARNLLEWRTEQMGRASRVIVMCDEGYQSSLAAATLCDLGVEATDLEGGFQAWRAAGLPVEAGAASAGAV
jgi:rhodanese-related sulfurtransferase